MPKRTGGLRLWAAMATVYVVWGSTYLGIAIAIETIPPFLMLALRFADRRLRCCSPGRCSAPGGTSASRAPASGATPRSWGRSCSGSATGSWRLAEQTVPSGIAAILIALIPLWFAVLGRIYFRDPLPGLVLVGIAIGLVGVVLLVWPFGDGANAIDLFGAGILICAPIGWAHGSLFSARKATLPARPLMASGLQMLLGSVAALHRGRPSPASSDGSSRRRSPPSSLWALLT